VHTNPGFQKYTTRVGGTLPNAGLCELYPGVPEGIHVPVAPSTTNITTLANGIRVASFASTSPSTVASIGVYITSGSRHETRDNAGTTHFLKHMVFTSTENRYAVQLVRDIEGLGATFSATAAREHILLESEVSSERATKLVSVLGDLLHPRIAFHEVERAKPQIEEEVSLLTADPVATVFELLHREAYHNRGLGQPLVAPKYNIEHLTHENLATYVSTHYTPQNVVVAAVGVPHSELVEAVQHSFEGLTQRSGELKAEPSKYTGGEASVPNGGDTHIVLAFEGLPSTNHKDGVVLSVLQRLLGGGSRYTRDGPGVGLQSRLSTKLLATNESVKSTLAFNLSYSDSGLFGVYVNASNNVPKVLEALVSEIKSLNLDATELSRAKELLKLDVLTGKRVDTLRFIGQQALAKATSILTPQQQAATIDSVTLDDVDRVAHKVFASNPTLVVVGDVSAVPKIEVLKAGLAKQK
jgi:processing peptidase subunit alpha